MPTVTAAGGWPRRVGARFRRWREARRAARAERLGRSALGTPQLEAPRPRLDVRVVTDSTAYLPADLVAKHGIEVVPLVVVVGGKERIEGTDITADEVAAALRAYTIVTTSRPNPEIFADLYRRLVADGATHIVSVHLSSQMSGTYDAAVLAAREASVPVEVIDSETIGMAMGFAVVSGAEAAAAGAGHAKVVSTVRDRLGPSTVMFYVHTLEHLRRGGRIGAASALLGSALSIKPILAVKEGRIVPLEKVRTSARAIARLEAIVVEQAAASGLHVDIAVHHIDAADRAHAVVEQLRERVPSARSVIEVELGAVVGAHVGPGTVAVALSPRPGDPVAEAVGPDSSVNELQ